MVVLLSSCKKLFGLDRQKDVDHISTTIDPHINKTAWQYLKERATGAPNTPDTIFRRMYEGILYAEIDSNEYKQPGRTYIFLHNDAVTRVASPVPTDTYWQRYKIGTAVGTKWSDYSKQQVKNWLLYLIVKGEYSYENLTPDNDTATTLLPLNTDLLNPNSIMTFKVLNDRDSKLRINDFFNTVRASQARTAGILSDNGPIHVLDRVVEFGVK
jgi:uncharacterized surface protein with fasciclin (FAS1) repeats